MIIVKLILIPFILYYLWVWIFVFKFNLKAMLFCWRKPKVNPESIVRTEQLIPDIIGKSKDIVRSTVPNTASSGQNEKQVLKPDIFAGEQKTKPEKEEKSAVVPPEELNAAFSNSITENIPAEYNDEETEEPDEALETDESSASGASFDELSNVVGVVAGQITGEKEKSEACHTIQKIQGTDIIEAFFAQMKECEKTINELMQSELGKFEKRKMKKELTYENFNLSDFV